MNCPIIYLKYGGGAEKTWSERKATVNQGDDSLRLNDLDIVACPLCGKEGYVDCRKYSHEHKGYPCARCSHPNIDWTKYDKKSEVEKND